MFIKFSNTLLLPDPELPVAVILKDGQKWKNNLNCDLFLLFDRSFPSLFKISHHYLVVVITLI